MIILENNYYSDETFAGPVFVTQPDTIIKNCTILAVEGE